LGLVVDRPAWQSIAEAVPLDDVDIDLIEIEVTPGLPLIGTRLGDNPPPSGMLATTLIREHKALIPGPDTIFRAGDFLVLAVERGTARVKDATAWARGEIAESAEAGESEPA
jgi:Trk K+ transport system NAD-binding subunit